MHGDFKDGEKIYMKISQGFKKCFLAESVILLLKYLNGLKQAVKVFWRLLLHAAKVLGLSPSNADPCIYGKWIEGRLVMMMSWIDNNAIVGQESNMLDLKKDFMKQFECDDCGPMNKYVGCMIERHKSRGIKFLQKVLLQNYRDECNF